MTEQVLSEFLPTSRFQLLPTPMVMPGKCAVCGAVDKPVVDFNLTIQFYGAVMICADNCLREAALGIGMVDGSKLIEAQGELAQSFENHLEQNGLVAVSSEWLRTLSSTVLGVSHAVFSANDSSNNLVPAEARETESDVPDPVIGVDLFVDSGTERDGKESDGSEQPTFEELFGFNGDSEQSDDAIVSEGPNVLPDDNGHGSTFSL